MLIRAAFTVTISFRKPRDMNHGKMQDISITRKALTQVLLSPLSEAIGITSVV